MKEKMRSITFYNHHSSPTISSSVFGDHSWGKSKSLFCSPSGTCSLGSLVRTQYLCDERWVHHICGFSFMSEITKKQQKMGFHNSQVKLRSWRQQLVFAGGLSVCVYVWLDHFLGFWKLIWKVLSGESSRAEQWDLVGICNLNGILFFAKCGWGRWYGRTEFPCWRGSTLGGDWL